MRSITGTVKIAKSARRPGRDNNFNALRMVAASAVLISHAFPIAAGPSATEPLEAAIGMSLGTLAVLSFFAMSGYFIAQSFQFSAGLMDFGVARLLRVYPGLIVVVILTVFLLGPIFTDQPVLTYLENQETISYLYKNVRLWPLQYDLPGVFEDNHYPRVTNGSLWSLAYEMACYGLVVGVGVTGLLAEARRFAVVVTVYAAVYIATIPMLAQQHGHWEIAQNFHTLTLPFMAGMAVFRFRTYIRWRLWLAAALFLVAAASYGQPWFRDLFTLAWVYALFYLGFTHNSTIIKYNNLGDYSYGMYIYAFPVEQCIASLDKSLSPLALALLSLPSTLVLAILSWHLVERHAIARRAAISGWLTRGRSSLFGFLFRRRPPPRGGRLERAVRRSSRTTGW